MISKELPTTLPQMGVYRGTDPSKAKKEVIGGSQQPDQQPNGHSG